MKNKIDDIIDNHYTRACELASNKVEKMARDILKKHDNLNEFIMCMGSYFFTYKNSDNHLSPHTQLMNSSWNYYTINTFSYLKPLNDFIGKWDDVLKITGDAMRFTATGEKITDW